MCGFLAARAELEEIVDQLANRGNARGAADEHDFVDLFRSDAGIEHGLLAGAGGAIEDRLDELLEDFARNLALVAVAVGQLDVETRDGFAGEADLGIDRSLADGLHRARLRAQIDAVLGVDFVERNGEQQVVDVVAAEVRVAIGRLHFEDAVAQLEDGDVEGAAAQVIDGDGAFLGAIEAIGKRGRGGLVHEAQDFEARHAARIFGGLALRVVEVCGHGDDGLRYRRAEEALRIALELAQNVGGNFGRRESQFAELDARHFAFFDIFGQAERKELQLLLHFAEAAAHEALDGVDDALRRLNEHLARAVADGDGGPAAVGRAWDQCAPPTAPDLSRRRRE